MEGEKRKAQGEREAIGRKDHVLYKEGRKPGIQEMFGFTSPLRQRSARRERHRGHRGKSRGQRSEVGCRARTGKIEGEPDWIKGASLRGKAGSKTTPNPLRLTTCSVGSRVRKPNKKPTSIFAGGLFCFWCSIFVSSLIELCSATPFSRISSWQKPQLPRDQILREALWLARGRQDFYYPLPYRC